MSKQINIEELKSLIAKEIREQNLNEALSEDVIEKIKNKILAFKDKESAEDIPSVVSELDIPSAQFGDTDSRAFPDEREIVPSPEQQINLTGDTSPEFYVDPGSTSTEQPSEPVVGYVPELPEMLKKAEPSELFVFRYNDIGESGENLSNKPMRLMDDPDVKRSMNDLWLEQGKTKAKIYVAKFEEIGEIEFNYADGTSKFTEKASTPDHVGGPDYKENPYKEESLPQIDEPTQKEMETYLKSSVDLEKVVNDIVMNILKDSLLTNTERAANNNSSMMEDIDAPVDRPGFGADTTQFVKPMEESKEVSTEDFKLTMEEIVKSEGFGRVVLPKELNESINSGDNSMLVNENSFVKKWEFKGETFYTPANRISKNKGYSKI